MFIGVDFGQARDFTAVCLIEKILPEQQPAYIHARTQEEKRKIQTRYHLRFIERLPLGTPYPDIVDYVKKLVEQIRKTGDSVQVVADATGCGKPVIDLLRKEIAGCGIIGVSIHGGDAVTHKGLDYRAPKRGLVATLRSILFLRYLNGGVEDPPLEKRYNDIATCDKSIESSYIERRPPGRWWPHPFLLATALIPLFISFGIGSGILLCSKNRSPLLRWGGGISLGLVGIVLWFFSVSIGIMGYWWVR